MARLPDGSDRAQGEYGQHVWRMLALPEVFSTEHNKTLLSLLRWLELRRFYWPDRLEYRQGEDLAGQRLMAVRLRLRVEARGSRPAGESSL